MLLALLHRLCGGSSRSTSKGRGPESVRCGGEPPCANCLTVKPQPSVSVLQGRMQSSGHRLRDMEQHHPLLSAGGDVEAGSLDAGVMVGGPHHNHHHHHGGHNHHHHHHHTLWFIQDGCGMVCAGITWFLVFYAAFVVNFVMLLPAKNSWYPLLNGAVFNSLAVLALASHLRTMLTDPVRSRRRRRVGVEMVEDKI